MPYFQIESRAGAVFGVYEGVTPEDAFATMVSYAGAGAEGAAADWIITRAPMRAVTLPARQFEDYDDCLAAACAHVCQRFGAESWQVSARWEDSQRDNITVEIEG